MPLPWSQDMPIPLERKRLRAELSARRAALGARERIVAAEALARQLEALPEFSVDQRVAGYWATGGEMPLSAALGGLIGRGQQYHLPLLRDDPARPLAFAAWRPGEPLVPNRYGIPEPVARTAPVEPEALELVLVPLLGFDRRGARLGHGAGCYDRAFAFLAAGERPREPLLVGIAFALQEVASLPAMPWDVPLDFVCTERELIECRR